MGGRRWGAAPCREGGRDNQGTTGGGEGRDHEAEGCGKGGHWAHHTGKHALAATLLGLGKDERHEACRKVSWHCGCWAGLKGDSESGEGGSLGATRGAGSYMCPVSKRELGPYKGELSVCQ